MSMSGRDVLRERQRFERFFRDATEQDRRAWVELAEFCRQHEDFLPWLEAKWPERYEQLAAGFRILAVDARQLEWRGPNGGRPEQLLPGSPGSFSDRTDWRYWLLMGGRGCVAAGTLIDRPWGNPVRIEDFRGGWVWSVDQQGSLMPAWASASYRKGWAQLFEVELDDGSKVTATAAHRFLSEEGWCRLDDLFGGLHVAVQGPTAGLEEPAGAFDAHLLLDRQLKGSEGRFGAGADAVISHRAARVKTIRRLGGGDFFDLTVDRYHNYVANGIVHHNSGKSLAGAEACRELLYGTPWSIDPRVAFVGRTLEAARTEMFVNTFMQIIPAGSIIAWRKQVCELELALPNGKKATINGYTSEKPDQLRGPNLVLAWADETASWADADRGSAAVGTAWSNLNYAVRVRSVDLKGNEWRPRIIATTTPKAVRLIHNLDPNDSLNPGPGIHDDEKSVVSSMSTLDNLHNLAPSFYEFAIKPFEGTRLYEQEVLGLLMMEAVGAGWSGELIDRMSVNPSVPHMQGGGITAAAVGFDPAAGEAEGAEYGIVVAGKAADGNCYVLQDASIKGRPSEACARVAQVAAQWGTNVVVCEANHGGQWVTETLARDQPQLEVETVWAKKSKVVRSQPATLLSDRGRLLLAGSFPKLTHQMRTYTGDGPSPDRLDAMVYAVVHLMPAEADTGKVVQIVTERLMHR